MKRLYIILAILILSIASCGGYSKEDLENDVKASIILENDDPNIIIEELNLIKTVNDNTYEGFVNTNESGESYQYNVNIKINEAKDMKNVQAILKESHCNALEYNSQHFQSRKCNNRILIITLIPI